MAETIGIDRKRLAEIEVRVASGQAFEVAERQDMVAALRRVWDLADQWSAGKGTRPDAEWYASELKKVLEGTP